MKVFIICPVRNATKEQKETLKEYKKQLIGNGNLVYYPDDDNPYEKSDKIGFKICEENRRALSEADEVHILFDPESRGTLFDLGMAFALNKRLRIVNIDVLIPTEDKSFSNMILEWSCE